MSIVQRLWREYSSSILVIVKTFQNFTMVILGGGTIVHPKARIAALAGPIIIGLICSQYHQLWLNSKSQIFTRVSRWNKYMIWYNIIKSFPGENNIIEEMVEIINEPGREGPEGTVQVILSSSISISWTIFMWLETFQCDKWMNNISPSVLLSKRDWQSLTESTVARNCCCN